MDVKHISFDALKAYWERTDHFGQSGKKVREVVRSLGPYPAKLKDPPRQSYGLFDGDQMIGATHLVVWSDAWLRYRTINVQPQYRGQNLGWFLLSQSVNMDWQDWKQPDRYLFGWVKRDHQAWSLSHGFHAHDDIWHDDHIIMIKSLSEF